MLQDQQGVDAVESGRDTQAVNMEFSYHNAGVGSGGIIKQDSTSGSALGQHAAAQELKKDSTPHRNMVI